MDESRLLGSDSENLRKWDDQIRRDRNHPSVAIWSVANEEFKVQSTAQGANAARSMQNYVKRLDPTRSVTYAAPETEASTATADPAAPFREQSRGVMVIPQLSQVRRLPLGLSRSRGRGGPWAHAIPKPRRRMWR